MLIVAGKTSRKILYTTVQLFEHYGIYKTTYCTLAILLNAHPFSVILFVWAVLKHEFGDVSVVKTLKVKQ